MPIYQYICKACGRKFDRFQWMSEEADPVCRYCDKSQAVRVMSGGVGVISESGLPGQTSRFEREDAKVFDLAKKARRMKAHGKMGQNEKPSFRDVERTYKHPLPPVPPTPKARKG